MYKVITFDKEALSMLCTMLDITFDENIIAFTKKGAITNVFDLVNILEIDSDG
jgi:hypothetical protein